MDILVQLCANQQDVVYSSHVYLIFERHFEVVYFLHIWYYICLSSVMVVILQTVVWYPCLPINDLNCVFVYDETY